MEEVDGNTRELEHIEYLPVMDMKNASIPLGQITSFAVNKAIQRAMVKGISRHGLGLFVYAGEDLPEEEPEATSPPKKAAPAEVTRTAEAQKKFEAVDAAIKKRTKNMGAEEKKAFAAELKALIGKVNYTAVTDMPTIDKLYEAYVKE